VKSAGGAARIQWRTSDQQQFPETGQTVDYTLPADEHGAEVAVLVPVQGTMVHFRLYLPAQQSPVAIDWIELTGSEPHAQPQRWDFNRK
jgi:hypothetical protein